MAKAGGSTTRRGRAKVQTFEQFAASRGAGRGELGEAATHRLPNTSVGQRKRIVAFQAARDRKILAKRKALRVEYAELVKAKKIVAPTRIQKLRRAAQGHPDNAQTKAARRLLAKYRARGLA